jgi:hypothetical protein
MKFMAIPCLILAGALTSSALAEQPGPDIEVTGAASVDAWRKAVSRDLDKNLDNEIDQAMITGSIPTGLATVQFHCSENGKPTAIELTRRSGDLRMNNMAKEAVGGIKTLHPLPAGVAADQVFVANILVASDVKEQQRYMATLRDEGKRQSAMASGSARPIAFNVSVNAPG